MLFQDKDELVDRITDSLTAAVVRDSFESLGNIGAKDEVDNEASSKEKEKKPVKDQNVDAATEQAMNNMLNTAIQDMLQIRQNKKSKVGSKEEESEKIEVCILYTRINELFQL